MSSKDQLLKTERENRIENAKEKRGHDRAKHDQHGIEECLPTGWPADMLHLPFCVF